MDSESVARRYYRRLFLLPRGYVLVATYVAILTLVAVLQLLPSTNLLSYLVSLMTYLVGGAVFFISYLPITYSKSFNVKRVLGLTTSLIAVFSVAEVLFSRFLGLRGLGILASSGLAYMILSAFIGPLRAIPASLIPQLITYAVINHIPNFEALLPKVPKALLVQALSLLSSLSFLLTIELRGKSLGVKPITLLNSFLATWFSSNPKHIEEEFNNYAASDDVLVRFVALKRDGGEPILLTFPTIHYGPFKNVGSARFIYEVEDHLSSRYVLYVFHTPGSHERNLVTSEDVEYIAKYVNTNVDGLVSKSAELSLCEPYSVVGDGGWEAYVIPYKTGLIAFIKNLVSGSDDLPYGIWGLLNDYGGVYTYAVVDSHSFKGPIEGDVGKFKKLLHAVMNSYKCVEDPNALVGHGEAYIRSIPRGVCFNKVKTLVMQVGNSRHALIYIYGNNMDGSFRKRLVDEVKELGFNYVEVVTPDDHSCAATLKESPYDIVTYDAEIVNAVKEAIKEAVNNMSKVKVSTADIIIKNVRIVSNKIWDMMKALDELGKLAGKYIPLVILAMNAAPTITLLT